MVEHRTLNPLVPSSSLGLSIPSDLAMCGVFEFSVIISQLLCSKCRHLSTSSKRSIAQISFTSVPDTRRVAVNIWAEYSEIELEAVY